MTTNLSGKVLRTRPKKKKTTGMGRSPSQSTRNPIINPFWVVKILMLSMIFGTQIYQRNVLKRVFGPKELIQALVFSKNPVIERL